MHTHRKLSLHGYTTPTHVCRQASFWIFQENYFYQDITKIRDVQSLINTNHLYLLTPPICLSKTLAYLRSSSRHMSKWKEENISSTLRLKQKNGQNIWRSSHLPFLSPSDTYSPMGKNVHFFFSKQQFKVILKVEKIKCIFSVCIAAQLFFPTPTV